MDKDDDKDKDKPTLVLVSDQSEDEKAEGKKRKRRKRRALTAKQEGFVRGLIKGLSQADAYRAAYQCDAMGSHAIHCEASLLASHPEVTQRLLAHETSMERSVLTSALTRRRWIIERLEAEAVDMDQGSPASRVRSLELLGKDSSVKLWSDVVETVAAEASPDEVRAQLEHRLTALLGKD